MIVQIAEEKDNQNESLQAVDNQFVKDIANTPKSKCNYSVDTHEKLLSTYFEEQKGMLEHKKDLKKISDKE